MLNLRTAILATVLAASHTLFAEAQTPGVTNGTILLGESAAFTGPAAQLGIQMNLGAKTYFDHVNKTGGVYGRRIEIRTRDDKYDPDLAAENTKKLIDEDRVFLLFGYIGTPTSNASLPIFTKAKVPFFAPFTGAESLRNPLNRLIFNIRASYFDETEKIVQQLDTVGLNKIAVFYQNDAYGQAGLAGVERALKKRNLKIIATGTVERNTTNVSAAVKTIAASHPDAVIMISAYTSIAEFVRQIKKTGYAGMLENVSFVGANALADALGPEGYGIGISQVVPVPTATNLPILREYQQMMKEAGHTALTFGSLEGFIAAKTLVEGLKRAGRDLTRDRLIAALETMTEGDVGGFFISFSPTNHNGSKFVDMTIIGRNGNFLQ